MTSSDTKIIDPVCNMRVEPYRPRGNVAAKTAIKPLEVLLYLKFVIQGKLFIKSYLTLNFR